MEKSLDPYSQVFTCDKHEEADTKIVYHACKADANSNILIRCSDTDVLIIMLGNMERRQYTTICGRHKNI